MTLPERSGKQQQHAAGVRQNAVRSAQADEKDGGASHRVGRPPRLRSPRALATPEQGSFRCIRYPPLRCQVTGVHAELAVSCTAVPGYMLECADLTPCTMHV